MKNNSFIATGAWILTAFCLTIISCRPQTGNQNNNDQNVAQPTQNDSIAAQKKREKAAIPANLDSITVDPGVKKVEEE